MSDLFKSKNNLPIVSIILLIAFISIITMPNSNNNFDKVEQLAIGEKFLQNQDYEQAILTFTALIEIEPRSVEGYLGLAQVYIAQGEIQKAIDILETGLSLTNDSQIDDLLYELKNPFQVLTLSANMYIGDDIEIEYNGGGRNNQVKVVSSNEDVAIVNGDNIQAIGVGVSEITVTSGNQNHQFEINSLAHAFEITSSKNNTIEIGEIIEITFKGGNPKDDVVIIPKDDDIIQFTNNTLTAISQGKTEIEVTRGNEIQTVSVTINAPFVEEDEEDDITIETVSTSKYQSLSVTTQPDAISKSNILNQLIANAQSNPQYTILGTPILSSFYMYRALLSSTEQAIYDSIYSAMLGVNSSVTVSNISSDRLSIILQSIGLDHPELFWVDYGQSYQSSGSGYIININYNPLANNLQANIAQYYDVIAHILANAMTLSTDIEKIKYVHDYLASILNFDVNSDFTYNQTSYGALIFKNTVCTGYAKSFQHIMQLLGIKTTSLIGETKNPGGHLWNLVEIDGAYYNLDVNFDDWSASTYYHKYFNITDTQINSLGGHVRSSLSQQLPSAYSTDASYSTNFT